MMSPSTRTLPTETARLKAGWAQFLQDFPASYELFAVTLAFNNRIQGTVLPMVSLRPRLSQAANPANGRVTHRLGSYRLVPTGDVVQAVNRVWLRTNKALWSHRYIRRGNPVCAYRGFIENGTENVHVHLAWAVPPTSPRAPLADTLNRLWLGIVPSGSTKIETMTNSVGWGDYLIKKVFTRDWSDRSGAIPRPTDAAENFLSSLPAS